MGSWKNSYKCQIDPLTDWHLGFGGTRFNVYNSDTNMMHMCFSNAYCPTDHLEKDATL